MTGRNLNFWPETMQNPPSSIQIRLDSEADTVRLAQAFAQGLEAGDVLLLTGGLAAGKTFFVKAAVASLGSEDVVTSPTYTLANIYRTAKAPVLHIDAYRLESSAEFTNLGLEDELERGISFIEWGAALADEFDHWVRLDLATEAGSEVARTATLSSEGARGAAILQQVLAIYRRGA